MNNNTKKLENIIKFISIITNEPEKEIKKTISITENDQLQITKRDGRKIIYNQDTVNIYKIIRELNDTDYESIIEKIDSAFITKVINEMSTDDERRQFISAIENIQIPRNYYYKIRLYTTYPNTEKVFFLKAPSSKIEPKVKYEATMHAMRNEGIVTRTMATKFEIWHWQDSPSEDEWLNKNSLYEITKISYKEWDKAKIEDRIIWSYKDLQKT